MSDTPQDPTGIDYRILLKMENGTWSELPNARGRNPREAIRASMRSRMSSNEGAIPEGEHTYAAVPSRNWNEETVTVKTEPTIAFGG